MYEAISIEERDRPAVALIYKDFIHDARSAASSRGMPVVRVVPETIPSEWNVMKDIEAGIGAVMDDIVDALTRPLTEEERSPRPKEKESPSMIIFKGDPEEVNRFYYRRGWTDGLPIAMPTEEAVSDMLKGTDLPPDHLVAVMGPRMGKATVEKIAINAVMAGALPTYMPLLIAGVEAMTDPRTGPTALAVSTYSFAPFWIINGPIRRDLHINHSYGALSPGDMANAAIGRALGLIIKNVRGVRKGMEDMGVFGNPGKYTMAIAENEEDNPWEPLHVEHGFDRDESTITLSFMQSFTQLVPYRTDDEGILSTVVYNVMPGPRGTLLVMLTPPLAGVLAGKSWTKDNMKAFIMENARVPWYRHPGYWADPADFKEKWRPMNPQDSSCILKPTPRLPDPIRVLVAGGHGTRISLFTGGSREMVTKKVVLPTNWEKLVAKYKNVVPMYALY